MIAHWLRTARAAVPLPVSAARTHVGHVRTVNEDRLLDAPERGLWAVADGMGGHARGDAAAAAVIAELAAVQQVGLADLQAALIEVDGEIRRALPGSGATVVVLALDDTHAHLAWAGDSRAYRLRNGALTLLTRDHSIVQQLVDAGLLDPADTADHPHAHVVTQAIGASEALMLDTLSDPHVAGDRLLLCSDGLSHRVDADAIARLLGTGSVTAAADALLAEGLARDGTDNLSVVVIDI